MSIIPQVCSDIMEDSDLEEVPKKPKIETASRSSATGGKPHIRALVSEGQYQQLSKLSSAHEMTVIAWKRAFGNEAYERAYGKALKLLKATHPKGLKHMRGNRSRAQRDVLGRRLRNHKDLADIFDATYDGPHQADFYQDAGPRGLITLANKYIGNMVSHARRAGRHEDTDLRASLMQSKYEIRSAISQEVSSDRAAIQHEIVSSNIDQRKRIHFPARTIRAEAELDRVEYSPDPAPPKEQEASWNLWVYKASDRSFVVAMEMEDLFGKRQPQKPEVKFDKIQQCLDRHPDLQDQPLKQGLVYVDEVRNYPVYDTITLKFAYEKWRNSGPQPNFLLYLDDRVRAENQPKQQLPFLALEVERASVDEDIDHEW